MEPILKLIKSSFWNKFVKKSVSLIVGSFIKVDSNGNTTGLIVEKYKFIISMFSNKEIIIKWNQIEKIGEDVILVNIAY